MRCLVISLVLTAGVASAETNVPVLDDGTVVRFSGSNTSEIIGGTRTTVGQYPSVVAITAGGGICTGTLVHAEWVLTAAHCIHPGVLGLANQAAVTSNVRVFYKTVDITSASGRTNMRTASNTIPKSSFSLQGLGANDIGLIKLATPITDVEPTPINFEAAAAPVGITVAMVGFGSTTQGGGGSVGIQFHLPSRVSTSCSSLSSGMSNTNLLCFNQQDNKGKCQGDSGGPSFAMINGKQMVVGVTSFGDQDCAFFGADTRTDIEKDFLLAQAPVLETKCTMDSECPNMGVCFMSQCIAQPFGPMGVGTECANGAACQSGICAAGPGGMKCTITCTPETDGTCPDGFECLAAGASGACWPASEDDEGGCCDTSGNAAPTMLFGIGLVAILLRRRRRA